MFNNNTLFVSGSVASVEIVERTGVVVLLGCDGGDLAVNFDLKAFQSCVLEVGDHVTIVLRVEKGDNGITFYAERYSKWIDCSRLSDNECSGMVMKPESPEPRSSRVEPQAFVGTNKVAPPAVVVSKDVPAGAQIVDGVTGFSDNKHGTEFGPRGRKQEKNSANPQSISDTRKRSGKPSWVGTDPVTSDRKPAVKVAQVAFPEQKQVALRTRQSKPSFGS